MVGDVEKLDLSAALLNRDRVRECDGFLVTSWECGSRLQLADSRSLRVWLCQTSCIATFQYRIEGRGLVNRDRLCERNGVALATSWECGSRLQLADSRELASLALPNIVSVD